MRCLKIVAIGLTSSLFSGISAADAPSFRELFGVDEEQAVEVFGSDTALCLSNAFEDFKLALGGQDPVHSTNSPFPQLLDGGTRFWEGDCYTLTVLKRLTTYRLPDGAQVSGWIVGPSLELRLSSERRRTEPISRTRFVFIQKRAGT
jgi:hypothetical protein